MKPAWMPAAACALAAACVEPVDYSEPVASDPVLDAPGAPPCMPFGDNEDGDCFGDKPDLCPTVAEPVELDADHDDVGDGCDPQPDVDNDIAFFAGFGPLDKPRAWEGSHWLINNGSLIVSAIADTGSATPADAADELSGPLLVVADVRVAAGEDAELSLFVEYAAELGDGSECYVLGSPDGTTGVLGWSPVRDGIRDVQQGATTPMLRPVFEEGARFQLGVEHVVGDAGPEIRCSYTTSGGFSASVSHPADHDGRGRLRLAVRDARVVVDSLIAYSLVHGDGNLP